MEQLKVRDIYKVVNKLSKTMDFDKVMELPIYLGDDDELNGIHCGWYCELVDETDKEDYAPEMIKDRDLPFNGKGILIS